MIPARPLASALALLLLAGSLVHARPCVDYASNPQWVGSTVLGAAAQAVTADDGHVYVGTRSCCPDLYGLAIYDFADPANLVWRGGLPLLADPTDLLLRGSDLFVSLDETGVAVIDVSDPAAPAQIGFLGEPAVNTYSKLTISPDGDLVYVGVTGGLEILDVSDPTDPVPVGSVTGHPFTEFAIARDDLAVAMNAGNLYTYDVADPIAPVLIDQHVADPHCWPADCARYRGLAVTADTAWVIYRRTWCTDPDENCFCTRSSARLATFDLANPTDLSPTYGPFFDSSGMTALELFQGRLHAFGGGDWIFDVSDPTRPELIHVLSTAESGALVPTGAMDLLISGGSSALRVFDVTNVDRKIARQGPRTDPVVDIAILGDVVYSFDSESHYPCGFGCTTVCTHIGAVALETGLPLPEVDWNACDCSYGYFGGWVKDTEIAGGDYFMTTGTLFRSELDGPGSPPSNPLALTTPHPAGHLAASDPYLFVAGGGAGFSVLDASADPPAVVAEIGTYHTIQLAVSGALTASLSRDPARGEVEFRTIDIGSLPTPPVHVGEIIWPETVPYYPGWLAFDGDVAVVGYLPGVLQVIDVSDPAAPRLGAEISVHGFGEPGWGAQYSHSGDVFGDVLYASAGQLGVAAYDLHDPDAPLFLGVASVGVALRIQATSRAIVVATGSGVISLPLDCMSLVHATLAPEPHGGPGLLLSAERNPFADATAFRFMAPGSPHPALDIYDVTGRRVRSFRTSVDNDGRGSVRWDGRDGAGRPVAPGIYFVRLQAGAVAETRKVVRVR